MITALGFPIFSPLALHTREWSRVQCAYSKSKTERGCMAMKEILAVLAALAVLTYMLVQALLTWLQPLFNAFAGKLH